MILNVIPWTRLNKTKFWDAVAMRYNEPAGRFYHSLSHVIDLYKYAQILKIPYSVELDFAILVHDMIYDSSNNKEIRTCYEFINMLAAYTGLGKRISEKEYIEGIEFNPSKVIDLIMTTINHSPINNIDIVSNDLVLLDLYSFSVDNDRKNNMLKLLDECKALYPNEKFDDVKENIIANLLRLKSNLEVYINNTDKEFDIYYKQWEKIVKGIQLQIDELNSDK